MNIKIYPSGTIAKSSSEERPVWTAVEQEIIRQAVLPHRITFYDPSAHVPNLDDTELMFGRDLHQVQSADFVVVDGRDRRGLGIGVEMMAAKVFAVPVVSVCPLDSHYRRNKVTYRGAHVQNYLHPHIATLSDVVVESFDEAGVWIRTFLESRPHAKDIRAIEKAMARYETELLHLEGRS
jgi:hypothetical protein